MSLVLIVKAVPKDAAHYKNIQKQLSDSDWANKNMKIYRTIVATEAFWVPEAEKL